MTAGFYGLRGVWDSVYGAVWSYVKHSASVYVAWRSQYMHVGLSTGTYTVFSLSGRFTHSWSLLQICLALSLSLSRPSLYTHHTHAWHPSPCLFFFVLGFFFNLEKGQGHRHTLSVSCGVFKWAVCSVVLSTLSGTLNTPQLARNIAFHS